MTGDGAAARTRRLFWSGAALWLAPLVVVCVMVARDSSKRSVTPVFHLAAERWRARGDLYADPRGYHYLPQFALLFAPFHALPAPAGDILWRSLSVALDGAFILARAEIDFRSEALVNETLELCIRCSFVGTKSFGFDYEIREQKTGRQVATAKSVQVFYDYATKQSMPCPDDMRTRLETFEGRPLTREVRS